MGRRKIADRFDWETADWDQSNQQIVALSGYSLSQVSRMRKVCAAAHQQRSIAHTNYKHVDWTLSNKAIAQKLGVSVNNVCSIRSLRAKAGQLSLQKSPRTRAKMSAATRRRWEEARAEGTTPAVLSRRRRLAQEIARLEQRIAELKQQLGEL